MPWDDSDEERPRRGRGRARREDEPPEPDGDSVMTCEVVMAAYYGNVDALGAALRLGGDIEELDPKEHWRPLHAAVFTDSTDAVRYLLRMRADVNAPGPHGQYPLHVAARDNSDEIVEMLLQAGADPGLLDAEGRTPEALAAERGSCRALAKLLPGGSGAAAAAASAKAAANAAEEAPPRQAPSAGSGAARSCFGPSATPSASAGGLLLQAQGLLPSASPGAPAAAGAPSGARGGAGRIEYGSAVDPEDERNVDDGVEEQYRDWATD